MVIFINDVPVHILQADEQPDKGRVNNVIDASQETLTQAKLLNHVWVQNVGESEFDFLLGFLDSRVPTNLLSLFVTVKNYEATTEEIISSKS